MPIVPRVLLKVLALLAVGVIAGAASGALWYIVGRASGFLPPFSVYLIPALVVFGVLFGWLLGRSPSYAGASELAVVCVLYLPLRVLIAIVTEDTGVWTALFRAIVLAGALYGTARFTRARRDAAMARDPAP
jgi:hypothetical protein